jgi:hypothetical protein
MTTLQTLAWISIACAAITTGGLVMVALVLVPIFRRYPPAMSLQLHQEVDRHCDRYLRPSTAVSGIAAVATLLLQESLRVAPTVCTLAGVAGTLVVVVVSEVFNVPINRILKRWSIESLPAEYAHWRRRWDRFHALRTLGGGIALGGYIAARLT